MPHEWSCPPLMLKPSCFKNTKRNFLLAAFRLLTGTAVLRLLFKIGQGSVERISFKKYRILLKVDFGRLQYLLLVLRWITFALNPKCNLECRFSIWTYSFKQILHNVKNFWRKVLMIFFSGNPLLYLTASVHQIKLGPTHNKFGNKDHPAITSRFPCTKINNT